MENEKISIDGVEYSTAELSEQALQYLNHAVNLQNKVAEAEFNLKQLRVAFTAFTTLLKKALPENPQLELDSDNAD